jgi:hypothetical protein
MGEHPQTSGTRQETPDHAEKMGAPASNKKRRLPSGLTGSALVSGIVSAIVAGAISFLIAHYQSQDAARQAISGQQTAAIVQLETAANVFYQGTIALWTGCIQNPGQPCANEAIADPWATYQATFNADRLNVSDPRAAALAARLDDLADITITYGTFNAEPYIGEMDTTYQQLIARCGQLVQGQP